MARTQRELTKCWQFGERPRGFLQTTVTHVLALQWLGMVGKVAKGE